MFRLREGDATPAERHTEFHREVGAVARLANAGQHAAAKRALDAGSAFASATQATVMAIRALQQATGGAKPVPTSAAPVPAAVPVAAIAAEGDWTSF